MRLYRLAMCLAVVGLTMSLGYSTSQAQAFPSLACAVGLNVHPSATHYCPVHGGRGRLQVRVVLQPRRLSVRTVLPARSPNSVRLRALILAAIIGRFRRRKNAA